MKEEISSKHLCLIVNQFLCSFSFFWASFSNHCIATHDLRAGVEQLFDCLIVQHHQAVQSVGRSMDKTLKVDGLFFCATLTDEAILHLCKQERELVKPDPGYSWEGHSGGVGASVGDENAVLWGCPPTPHSIDDPPTTPNACCCCHINWWDVVRRTVFPLRLL